MVLGKILKTVAKGALAVGAIGAGVAIGETIKLAEKGGEIGAQAIYDIAKKIVSVIAGSIQEQIRTQIPKDQALNMICNIGKQKFHLPESICHLVAGVAYNIILGE